MGNYKQKSMIRIETLALLVLVGQAKELAGEGEICEGWDEDTSSYFPNCKAGLTCTPTCEVSIPGACNTCVRGEDALEGETCEGFDERTGAPFPNCAKGLECKPLITEDGEPMMTIPGRDNSCFASVELKKDADEAGSGATAGLQLAASLFVLHLLAF